MKLRRLAALSIALPILVSCGGSSPEEPAPPVEVGPPPPAPQEEPTPARPNAPSVPEAGTGIPAGTRGDPFVGHGTIRAVQAGQRQLLIQHGDIPGFMPAMMMVFPVDPETSIEGLKAGDSVTFNIERVGDSQYRIFDIEEETVVSLRFTRVPVSGV